MAYFTLTELRALPDMSDSARYPDARCTAVRDWVESRFESFIRCPFEARTVTDEIHSGDDANRRGGWLELQERYPIAVTAVTGNGTAFTAGELADLSLRFRTLRRRASGSYSSYVDWPSGHDNLLVTYTHGYSSTPPGDIKEAALQACRLRLIATMADVVQDERRVSINTEVGTFNIAVAGKDRPTGYPDIDAVLLEWRDRVRDVPGVA